MLKFVGLIVSGNLQKQQRPSIKSIGFSISYFLFTSLLNSRFLDLNFLLNHLIGQSPANFISVLNISATANSFFFLATFNTQSLNCNKVLSSLYCNFIYCEIIYAS